VNRESEIKGPVFFFEGKNNKKMPLILNKKNEIAALPMNPSPSAGNEIEG